MLNAGTILAGRYEILSKIGAGGMGEVYRAKDIRLDREVAIKVLPQHLSSDAEALSRFEREAKALAALSHTNILTIHDFCTDGSLCFAVMELLKGQTLRTRLVASKPSWHEALQTATCITEGLAAAHSTGVIHRDLKPENIFLTSDGGIKILDFGLARRETPEAPEQSSVETITRTRAGTILGTVPYMSPEQARGDPLDVRSDIFSFGTMFYEMLAGKRPFERRTAAETIADILNFTPPPLDEDQIPLDLNQIVQHCLEKNPDKRFQSARDLGFALKTLSSGSQSLQVRKPVFRIRMRTVIGVTATLLLLLIAGLLYQFSQRNDEINSLAILPFANASQNPDTEYLSDGISESLISNLSKFPKIRVMARDTVFTYKGKNVDSRKVGKDLNVKALVTGRVIQQGDTLVIWAHLVNTSDGSELWGEQYNRKLADVLEIQEEISREIARKLRSHLTGEEEKLVTRQYTANNEAYQFYLRGRYHRQKGTPEDYQKSLEYFKKATEKDPQYALAYVGLADAYTALTFEGQMTPDKTRGVIENAIKRAAEIDSSLGEVVYAASTIKWNFDWDFEGALEDNQRAIILIPNSVYAHRFYSQKLRALGRFDEAIEEAKRALALDPLWHETNLGLGATYSWAGRFEEAIEQFKKTIDLNPTFPTVHDFLADVYARKKMFSEAMIEEEEYLRLIGDQEGAEQFRQDFENQGYLKARQLQYQRELDLYLQAAEDQYVSPMAFAVLYAQLNQKDLAFKWLEKAYEEKSFALTSIKTNPEFENLRSDPRFSQLLKRIGLP